MRIRIKPQTGKRGGDEVDLTPPRVEHQSGDYRALFESGKVYEVTSAEWLMLRPSGLFEQVRAEPVRRYTLATKTKVGAAEYNAGAVVELTDAEATAAGLSAESGVPVEAEPEKTDDEILAARRATEGAADDETSAEGEGVQQQGAGEGQHDRIVNVGDVNTAARSESMGDRKAHEQQVEQQVDGEAGQGAGVDESKGEQS